MNKFEDLYVVKFLKNGMHQKSNSSTWLPDFKTIYVLDFFYLRDSFLKGSGGGMQEYYERLDEILKTVKIFP